MDRKRKEREDDVIQDTKVRRKSVQTDAATSAHLVAQHYNERPDVGVEKRKESKIIRLRSFNNWVKSVLIQTHIRRRDCVFDMGCGKGGDLLKFAKAGIRHLVAADIAEVSLEQMKERYRSLRHKSFTAEFHPLDCYKDRIDPLLSKDVTFDAVSMQFCLHYAFESESKARRMLENVTCRLRRGGRFIGTFPDANWIVKRVRQEPAGSNGFGNSIYRIDFQDSIRDTTDDKYRKEGFTRFGCRYMFHLVDAVDCPEYLVHWPTFEKLANEYGLRLLFKQNFHDFYQAASKNEEFSRLLRRIGVIGGNTPEMTAEEWEAARIYLAFAFEKK